MTPSAPTRIIKGTVNEATEVVLDTDSSGSAIPLVWSFFMFSVVSGSILISIVNALPLPYLDGGKLVRLLVYRKN
jgi:membrane-associated protease RseP (regulator of RpoE activity)